ncbi:putative lipoprotein [Mycobacterium intracellulare 1956]|uniref:Putative lipoprotein n=1 Tax=Mycobacterium intracellulare 1956 TaxID=1299331 RepID=X8CTM7_MYCIT|nr:putative lipoprotein [Mycobacterium intracellulare]EUA58783.1 putative lipoprotein [Mycobacterium intracellulare 1956]
MTTALRSHMASRLSVALGCLSSGRAPRGMFAVVNIGVRAYWRFIEAPGGAGDEASG